MSTKRRVRSSSADRHHRKSSPDSGVHTTIEYSPESEGSEGDFDTLFYPISSIRERSKSSDALNTEEDNQKRKKIHRLSGVTVARFPQHYQDHGDLLKIVSPAITFDKKLRYSREAHVKHCHWKPKKKEGPEFSDACLQVSLKGPSYDKNAQFDDRVRDAKVQCYIETVQVEVKPVVRDAKVQCYIEEKVVEKLVQAPPPPSNNYDDLLHELKKLQRAPCQGPHIPEGMVQQVSSALIELAILLKALDKKSVIIDSKENDMLATLQKISVDSNHSERSLQNVIIMLKELQDFMRKYKSFDDTKLIDFLNSRINQLQTAIQELRKEHADVLRAIEENKGVESHLPEKWMADVEGFLLEILSLMKTTTISEDTYMEPMPVVVIGAVCTCSELVQRNQSDSKFVNRNFLPGLCQRCVNDHRGREFLRKLHLPTPMSGDILNLVGNIIQSIMDDNLHRVKVLLMEFVKLTPTWSADEHQIFMEALLHLALIWDRQVTAQYIVTFNDVPVMYTKIANNTKIFNLCDFVKSAAEAQNPEVLLDLLKDLTERERVIVINSPAIYGDKKALSLFEAARRGDVKCFEILVDNGAELDLVENGNRSILHELIYLSDAKDELESARQWEKTLYNMLDVIYIKTSKWWERYQGKSEYSEGSSASRKSALKYLFLHVRDKNDLNVLEYCGEHGTRYIMKKIINSPPFAFLPDPFAAGYHSGEIGYLMTNIDSSIVNDGLSVLERIIRRNPKDSGPILRLQPFRSLVEDKWNRYKPFFFILCIAYIAYMCIYTACVFTRPSPNENTFNEMYNSRQDWARLVGEIFCLVCLPLFLYGELTDACRNRWTIPRPSDWFGLFRILNVLFFILTIVAFILRLLANDNEEPILSVCLLIGWMNSIHFLAAWKSTGIFPIVMFRVIRKNFIFRFLPCYMIVLMALSSSTFINYQYAPFIVDPYTNNTFLMTPFTMLKMTFALSDASHIKQAREPIMGIILFIVFVIIGIVLMFFLLLAMIAETFRFYTKVLLREWIYVRAVFAVHIENRLPTSFYISYDPHSEPKSPSIFGDTHMKYVVKIDRKRDRNGGVLDTEDCVVLLPREDPPVPERDSGETKTPLDVEDVFRKPVPGGKPSRVTPHTDLTIIDLTHMGQSNSLYESLGNLDKLSIVGPPCGKTVLRGAPGNGNSGRVSNTYT